MSDPPRMYHRRPCACGTGRRYGHWCLTTADAAHASLSPVWGIDVRAVTPRGRPAPVSRTMAVLVVAGETLVYANLVNDPPADAQEFAELLHAALTSAERSTGIAPAAVFVRNPDVARLFSAAAVFHDAEPWRVVDDYSYVVVHTARGARLCAAVLGSNTRGTESTKRPGLVLSESDSDLEDGLAHDGSPTRIAWLRAAGLPADAISNSFRKPCLWFTFEPASELPPIMHREVLKKGWRVRPDAFPRLIAMNTPGDGVTDADLLDLIDVLEAVPRFLDANARKIATHTEHSDHVQWTDAITGATLALSIGAFRNRSRPGDKRRTDESITSCGPVGPGARAGDFFTADEDLVSHAAEERTILDELVEEEDGDGWEVTNATVQEKKTILGALIDYVVFQARVPIAAITEVDLCRFLYGEWPRHSDSFTETRQMLLVLEEFFVTLVARDIFCTFAINVLIDQRYLAARCITYARASQSEDALAEWTAALEHGLWEKWLTPRHRLTSGGVDWRKATGPKGKALWYELTRIWLKWRQELVFAGADCTNTPMVFLVACQRQWEQAPHAAYDGLSPAAVVAAEAARSTQHGREG